MAARTRTEFADQIHLRPRNFYESPMEIELHHWIWAFSNRLWMIYADFRGFKGENEKSIGLWCRGNEKRWTVASPMLRRFENRNCVKSRDREWIAAYSTGLRYGRIEWEAVWDTWNSFFEKINIENKICKKNSNIHIYTGADIIIIITLSLLIIWIFIKSEIGIFFLL